jgi:hypothetical protein
MNRFVEESARLRRHPTSFRSGHDETVAQCPRVDQYDGCAKIEVTGSIATCGAGWVGWVRHVNDSRVDDAERMTPKAVRRIRYLRWNSVASRDRRTAA